MTSPQPQSEAPSRSPDDGAGGIVFEYDGVAIEATAGESVAAALVAHGCLSLSAAPNGEPRGVFCGMGVCHDCRVTIDGRAGQRACLTKMTAGMRVTSSVAKPQLAEGADLARAPDGAIPEESVDILVVGAGPAGLAAATAARGAGASVIVLDERPIPGGQFYKQPGRPGARPTDAQARAGAKRIAAAKAAGVEIRSGTVVWGGFREGEALVIGTFGNGVARYIRPRALIIASGAYEQPGVFPGWTLPGAMTTGALQTLLRGEGRTPPGRILVAGNGPLNLQVAAELTVAGADVVGVVEAAPPPWTRPLAGLALALANPLAALIGMRHLAKLRLAGIPLLWASRVARLEGAEKVEAAVLTDASGREHRLAVDLVAVNEGFSPANELARLLGVPHRMRRYGFASLEAMRGDDGSTALPDVFVVGEAGGFGGAPIAEAQGRLAGLEAARRLGLTAAEDATARRDLSRHRRFQSALWRLFAAEDPGLSRATADTLVCRCEQVALGAIKTALAAPNVGDLAGLKRLTRAGMGRCQGRYCMPQLAALVPTATVEQDFPAPQMPLKPIPAVALAVEKSEWGGHKRALLPPAREPRALPPLGPIAADVVVIGAGIAGLSIAYFLAKGGADVVVIDRGQVNGQASGGNAGSLHGQLLSFDFGARSEAGGSPAARTLPLQRDSIALWQELERELAGDFDISLTGGLMVAETERDLRFLEAKTQIERKQGIDCHVIDADEVQRLEPALNRDVVGAAYCPGEGKINPLRATQAILKAALAAGARVFAETGAVAIARDRAGFVIDTPRGQIHAGRIVNAAGGFASEIGAMLGRTVPVYGAPLQMIVTEPVAPLITRLVAHADRHLTLKQAANGSLLIGGGWTAGLDPVHQHPRPIRASLEGNLWVAQHVIPAIRKLHIVRSWAAMNINIDGAPILGEDPGMPGLYHAVMSNGYTLGPLVGRITAEMMLLGATDRDVAPFSLARFGDAA